MKKIGFSITALCIILVACNVPLIDANITPDTGMLQTGIAGTLQALTPSESSGSMSGTATINRQSTPIQEATVSPTPSVSPTADLTATLEPGIGSVSGEIINYPYGAIPQLSIVAFEQEPPYHYWYVILGSGSTFFSMDEFISSGKYQVVAYDPSGHKGGCTVVVAVKKDQMATCDITDWTGSYPDKPAGVP
jgi:hypothetical protein